LDAISRLIQKVYLPYISLVDMSFDSDTQTINIYSHAAIGLYDLKQIATDFNCAWSDENLRSICSQVTSGLFFAHVRAATGTSTSRSNCHPFSHGKWMFMHNGQIGGWHTIRRDVEALITNETYASRLGTTDSEAIFLAALSRGLDANPIGAMTETIRDICTIQTRHNITTPLRFTAAMTDGVDMFAFRWSSDEAPPTLYWQATDHGMIVVSEPLDHEHGHWTEVPKNSAFSAVGSKVACSDFSPQGSP
jgi:glutamine amidotransferase